MWAFFSRRFRTWVLFTIAVPLVARAVHAAAERARASDPAGKRARVLSRADTTLGKVSRRKAKGRRA